MEDENSTGRKVRCDACGCAFEPKAQSQMEDGIEYTFFRCDFCGKAYMVSVTDEKLRESIAEYVRLAEQNKAVRLSEPEQFRMQKLKTETAERAKALRRMYLKEEGRDGE